MKFADDHYSYLNMAPKVISPKCCFNKFPALEIVVSIIITVLLIFLSSVILTINEANELVKRNEHSVTLMIGKSRMYSLVDIKDEDIMKLQVSVQNATTFEVYGDVEKIFWTLSDGSTIFYKSYEKGKENDTDPVIILQEPEFKPHSMAYDNIGNNLYVIDMDAGILIVINVETKLCTILIGTLIKPDQIEVDSYRGFLFILQFSSILRSNMDGTSVITLSNVNIIGPIALDRRTQKIFWGVYGDFMNLEIDLEIDYIESSNYEGKKRESFYVDTEHCYKLMHLAVNVDRMFKFWQHFQNESVILRFCTTHDGICTNESEQKVNYSGNFGLARFNQTYAIRSISTTNPCQKDNGGCQHICLIAPEGKHSCTCKLGWQLEADNETCKETEGLILYMSDRYLRGQPLDVKRKTSVDVILPISYDHMENSKFDYDPVHNIVYYTNGTNIRKAKLKGFQSNISVVLEDEYISDLSYDWMTGNLYYLQNKPEEGCKIKVSNVELGSEYKKTLLNCESKLSEKRNENPDENYLGMHPDSAYLFYYHFAKPNNVSLKVIMRNGTLKFHHSLLLENANEVLIAVDYIDQRIYWLKDSRKELVMHAKFDGSDERSFIISNKLIPQRNFLGVYFFIEINIYKEWLYLCTLDGTWRVDKLTGNNAEEIGAQPERSISSDIKIIEKKLDDFKNPCSKENGGCEQFCFVEDSKAVCYCRDGEKLVDNHCEKDF